MKPTRKSSSSSDAPVADDMIRLNFLQEQRLQHDHFV